MRSQLAKMSEECREFTTGPTHAHMICAKPGGHVAAGDEYHFDPFHNVRWKEMGVEATPEEIAARVAAHGVPIQVAAPDEPIEPVEPPVVERRVIEPLRSGIVYVRPIRRPVLTRLGGLLAGVLFA